VAGVFPEVLTTSLRGCAGAFDVWAWLYALTGAFCVFPGFSARRAGFDNGAWNGWPRLRQGPESGRGEETGRWSSGRGKAAECDLGLYTGRAFLPGTILHSLSL